MRKMICYLALGLILFMGVTLVDVKAEEIDYDNQIKFVYRYDRPLNNTCYWIDSSVTVFTTHINNAAYDWAHLNNPIKMTPVSDSYATHMDFYGKPRTFWKNEGGLGLTLHYKNGDDYIYPDNGNWFYAEIFLNLQDLPNYSIQGTTAHEMGHAFGLAHWKANPYSIMAQTTNRIVNTVQAIDNQHLNEKYS